MAIDISDFSEKKKFALIPSKFNNLKKKKVSITSRSLFSLNANNEVVNEPFSVGNKN